MGTKGGLNLHQLKGNKKLHSPTGDPGIENAWGVDFVPLRIFVTAVPFNKILEHDFPNFFFIKQNYKKDWNKKRIF